MCHRPSGSAAFKKVIEAVDQMAAELKKEQLDEVKHKDEVLKLNDIDS
jgi:hypothetical protein